MTSEPRTRVLRALPVDLGRDGYSLLTGPNLEVMRRLPSNSVHTIVTSPPYYQLRSYDTEEAKAFEHGSESTLKEYVRTQVAVFREARRILRPDGVLFLNIGDTFNTNVGGPGKDFGRDKRSPRYQKGLGRGRDPSCKPKDLLGVPWEVAFALRRAGWYLRSDIVWAKPNPMPESVADRPTRSHEFVFLLTKQERYFWDKESVREKGITPAGTMAAKASEARAAQAGVNSRPPEYKVYDGTRNLRDVWWVTPKPFRGAHFATFPEDLVVPCISAGSSEAGCCARCGAPRRRVTELLEVVPTGGKFVDQARTANPLARANLKVSGYPVRRTIGWDPSCGASQACHRCTGTGIVQVEVELEDEETGEKLMGTEPDDCPRCAGSGELREGCRRRGELVPSEPCIILDPYSGAATTGVVALRLGRRYIGIELSEKYQETIARPRLARADLRQGVLLPAVG